jgi:hypothetical protein
VLPAIGLTKRYGEHTAFHDAFRKEHKNFIKANTAFKNDTGQFAMEERHASLLKQHEEIIARQEASLKRHAHLEQQHSNGITDDFSMQ